MSERSDSAPNQDDRDSHDDGEVADEERTSLAPASVRRRLPLFLLALGALATAAAFERTAPRSRTVRLRLDAPASVIGVDITWSDGDGDVLGASRWSFEAGRAPTRVDAEVRVRRGALLHADVRVVREGGEERRQRVSQTVGADETVSLDL